MKKRLLALAMALCLLTPAALAAEPTAHAEEYAEENAVTVTADAGDAAEGDPLYDYMLRTAKEQMKPKTGKRLLARAPGDVTYARNQLEGIDLLLYDAIKSRIVELDNAILAANQTTTLSTSFTFPVSDFGYNTVWTNSDLGLEPGSLLEIGEGEYHLTAAAQEAINAKISGIETDILGNFSLVHTALLSDCPYYFYWYNKQGGCQQSWAANTSGTYEGGDTTTVTVTMNITVAFAVASDYGGVYTQGENETPVYTGNYTINTADAAFGKIQTALTKAQSIVTTNANKSDFDKLTAYKDAICKAVTYDDDAADRSATATDTDPWQLIYAFDDDPQTNVVCEGYAKAFKYLCDLSTFQGGIQCYLVSGDMAAVDKETFDSDNSGNITLSWGAHMWNVVTMDDGENYLVDVTNCDDETIGDPDKLFLKGMDMRETTNNGGVWCSKGIANNVIYYVYDGETLGLWGNTNPNVLIVSLSDYVPLNDDHDAVSITVTNMGTNEGVVTVSGMLRPGNRVLLARYRDGRLVLAKVVQENTTDAACYFDVSNLDAFRVTNTSETLRAFVVDESFRPTIESQFWSSQ